MSAKTKEPIGKKITNILDEKGKPITWLSAESKIARPTLSKLINGKLKRGWRTPELDQVAKALGTSLAALIGGTDLEDLPQAKIVEQEDSENLRLRLSVAQTKIAELESEVDALKSELSQKPTQEQLAAFETALEELQQQSQVAMGAAKKWSDYAGEKIEKQSKEIATLRTELGQYRRKLLQSTIEKKALLEKTKDAFERAEKYAATMRQLEKKAKSSGDWAAFMTALGLIGLANKS